MEIDILSAIGCHFIGDFGFQSDYMAMNKGKSWEVLAYHCLTYTAVFAVLGASIPALVTLAFTHFCIDAFKARYGVIKSIWQDQLCHIIILLIIFL